MTQHQKWESRFDGQFDSRFNPHGFETQTHAYMPVKKLKAFISEVAEEARREVLEALKIHNSNDVGIMPLGICCSDCYMEAVNDRVDNHAKSLGIGLSGNNQDEKIN